MANENGRPRDARIDAAVLDGAKALALTVADLWLRDGALDAVKAAFAGADRRR